MLVLLPPSETKRDGGQGERLDLRLLAFPGLTGKRQALIDAVMALAADQNASVAALGLGPKQAGEVERNRQLVRSATLPAIDRYTGVLYDALEAHTMDAAGRAWAARHVVVHSALFGPVGALDPIPGYRLSHDSRLPGISLKKHWRDSVAGALATTTGLLLDLRSEAYRALGPVPVRPGSLYLRVVAEGVDGHRRALNHFNKKAKGQLTQALMRSRPDLSTTDDLLSWASSAGFRLRPGAPGELQLVVEEIAAARG